jgi:HSP20 family protein
MNPEDIEISFVDRILTIRGSRRDVDAKQSYHCLEIPYGEFDSEIVLPGMYDEEAIEAKYENGFLRIVLPKVKREHRVPIRVQPQVEDKE